MHDGSLEIEDRVDAERELAVALEAVKEIAVAVVVADLGTDLEVLLQRIAGEGRDRYAERRLVEVLVDAGGEAAFVVEPFDPPCRAELLVDRVNRVAGHAIPGAIADT